MADQSASAQIDRDLARRALEKRQRGQTPSRQEAAALRRIEKTREEDLRWEFYRTVPKKHWREMSGRQATILNDQADRYGLPIRGPTIDLPAVVLWLHDFLARNKHRLSAVDGDDPMSGPPSPALEKWREEKWRLARLERRERENDLVPREKIHEGLTRMANILRTLGEAMQRNHGDAAGVLVEEALDDWLREIDALFYDDGHDNDNPIASHHPQDPGEG